MTIPPGHTEATVLDAIERAVNILASSFVFGHWDVDDIKQQGRMEALRALKNEKYNPELPLPNFLYAHIRNRLINLLRDEFRRSDAPCKECHAGEPCSNGDVCEKYRAWKLRNDAKANLMRPADISNIPDDTERRTRTESTVVSDVSTNELMTRINRRLSVEMRASFLQMRSGVSLPKARRLQVEQVVRDILGDALCQDEEK